MALAWRRDQAALQPYGSTKLPLRAPDAYVEPFPGGPAAPGYAQCDRGSMGTPPPALRAIDAI